MNKNKARAVIAITTISLLLSGCSGKEVSRKENNVNKQVVTLEPNNIREEESKRVELIKGVEIAPVESKKDNGTLETEEHNTDKYETEEQIVTKQEPNVTESSTVESKEFTYFKDAKNKVKEYIDSEDFNNLKSKGKEYVVTGIDFIFYNKPINGVYFNDLTDEVKSTVIKDVEIIDNAIMAYYPDYKENIGSKYSVASEFLSEKYLSVLDKIKEYLGDENYEALGNMKDKIVSDVCEIKDNTFNYIKDKYNDWKNK